MAAQAGDKLVEGKLVRIVAMGHEIVGLVRARCKARTVDREKVYVAAKPASSLSASKAGQRLIVGQPFEYPIASISR